MIIINRRKYLAELGKLLTFMYEEDRQEALALYEQMFDEANDETELIRFLGSPTKQAVAVAHAYNANNRKLATSSQKGAEFADVSGKEIPPFVQTINNFIAEARKLGILNGGEEGVPEDLFEEDEPETPEEETEEIPESENTEEPAEVSGPADTDFPEEDSSLSELPAEAQEFMDSVSTEEELQALFAPSEETAAEAEEESAEEAEEETPAENFALDLGPVPEPERSDPDQINEVMAAFREKDEAEPAAPAKSEQTTLSEFDSLSIEEATPWRKSDEYSGSGKANIPIMICYLIAAVPLTAIGVLILLIPALLFLALSVACGIVAFYTASSAFGNFAVFADIMVVLGAALVFAALALFFFWIFLWFIIGAIAGLINFSIRLGGKICFMEGKQA